MSVVLGAIAGDIIGSVYEARPTKARDFPLFVPESRPTDDTVLTVAVADALIRGRGYAESIHEWVARYPDAGYGGTFIRWALSRSTRPYGSWGNGAAMRVSPVAWAFDGTRPVLDEARRSAAVTHDHPEGVKGAQAVALAVLRAREGLEPERIRREIGERFGYDLDRTVEAIRPGYGFDVSCQGSVPESLVCFLEADGFEDAVRDAVALGGDADTMGCIAGAVAEAAWGVPAPIAEQVRARLDPHLAGVLGRFRDRYGGR